MIRSASAALALRARSSPRSGCAGGWPPGSTRALGRKREASALTAAVPVDAGAVELARPVAGAARQRTRSRERVAIRGLAITQLLLTEPGSPLYASRYPEQLYEWAREALLAL